MDDAQLKDDITECQLLINLVSEDIIATLSICSVFLCLPANKTITTTNVHHENGALPSTLLFYGSIFYVPESSNLLPSGCIWRD